MSVNLSRGESTAAGLLLIFLFSEAENIALTFLSRPRFYLLHIWRLEWAPKSLHPHNYIFNIYWTRGHKEAKQSEGKFRAS